MDGGDAGRAHGRWWSVNAAEYHAEHGIFLGDAGLRWCPEGLTEDRAGLLGPVAGRRVLEVGCGAGQGTRWVARHGGDAVGVDIAHGMLAVGRGLNASSGVTVPLVLADARHLPFARQSFDVAFTAFGAIPFVPDPEAVHREVARVLRPRGRWVFSTSHPLRWVFADDPSAAHLRVVRPYFDTAPYAEYVDGDLEYSEYQHTVSDLLNGVLRAGFILEEVVEPRWEEENGEDWGAWSAERAPWVPGTIIVRSRLP
ncbi:MAG: class I SAM-dependent methyltransferase [Actinomycetota bacterium]